MELNYLEVRIQLKVKGIILMLTGVLVLNHTLIQTTLIYIAIQQGHSLFQILQP